LKFVAAMGRKGIKNETETLAMRGAAAMAMAQMFGGSV
jgi:hypothetical protein